MPLAEHGALPFGIKKMDLTWIWIGLGVVAVAIPIFYGLKVIRIVTDHNDD
jgi:hypothetical protein